MADFLVRRRAADLHVFDNLGDAKSLIDYHACDFQFECGYVMFVLFGHCCFLSR